MGKKITTTDKARYLINSNIFTKSGLTEELGLTRPTLNSRLEGRSDWKKLEVKWVNNLYYDKIRQVEAARTPRTTG